MQRSQHPLAFVSAAEPDLPRLPPMRLAPRAKDSRVRANLWREPTSPTRGRMRQEAGGAPAAANPGSIKMQSHRDVNVLFGLTLAMLFAIGLVLLVIAVRSYWLIA
jgi:hypothetical protein